MHNQLYIIILLNFELLDDIILEKNLDTVVVYWGGIGRPQTSYSWAFYHKKIWIKGEKDNKFDPLKCIGNNWCEQGKGFKTKKPITSFQLIRIGKNRICFWDQKPRMCAGCYIHLFDDFWMETAGAADCRGIVAFA